MFLLGELCGTKESRMQVIPESMEAGTGKFTTALSKV